MNQRIDHMANEFRDRLDRLERQHVNDHGGVQNRLEQREFTLQDFTVLPTDHFRRCVIRSSSVIFLSTSSPTDYVRRLSLRR